MSVCECNKWFHLRFNWWVQNGPETRYFLWLLSYLITSTFTVALHIVGMDKAILNSWLFTQICKRLWFIFSTLYLYFGFLTWCPWVIMTISLLNISCETLLLFLSWHRNCVISLLKFVESTKCILSTLLFGLTKWK